MKVTMSRIGAVLTGLTMLAAVSLAHAPAPKAKPAKEPATTHAKHELVDRNSATKEQLATLNRRCPLRITAGARIHPTLPSFTHKS